MIFQFEMYFTNEYIEEIVRDLSMVMDVCVQYNFDDYFK